MPYSPVLSITDQEKKVLNYRGNYEQATLTLFRANGLSELFTGITEDQQQKPQHNGTLVFDLGESMNKGLQGWPPNANVIDDAYAGNLTVTLRSYRPEQATGGLIPSISTWQQQVESTIMGIMQIHRGAYNHWELMPWYRTTFIRHLGTRHYTDETFWQDVADMVFRFEFSVLPGAWTNYT